LLHCRQPEPELDALVGRDLLAAVGQKYDQYLELSQQDAHEFLRILLDAMRMEEQDVNRSLPPLNLADVVTIDYQATTTAAT